MTMKHILPLLLILALLLTGCASASTPGKPVDDGTAAAVPTGIDLSGYAIVRSTKASDLVSAISVKLFADLSAMSDLTYKIEDDFLLNAADPASDEVRQRLEILIGETNRPESALDTALDYNEALIKQVGNKIVIHAGCEATLEDICAEFVQMLSVKDGKVYLCLPDGASYTAAYNAGDSMGLYLAADQKNAKVSIYSINRADMSTATLTKSFKFERSNIAGLKVRTYQGKEVLLAVYGTSSAKMIDVASGELMWFQDSVGNNPHAIELTPNGVIAVASSTGAVLHFYNAADAEKMCAIPVLDAHGVLYDPDTELVFAVGGNELRAFSVSLNEAGIPVATEDQTAAFTLPTDGAHDLQPVYGNTDRLWITTESAVYQYSVSEKKIYTDYLGQKAVNVKNVKGIANFDDGSMMYVTPDGKFETWTSQSVYYVHAFNGKFFPYKISDPNTGIYKLRVYNANYQ